MSPLRRSTTVLAAVTALAGGALVGSSPASAAGTCTVSFNRATVLGNTITPVVTYDFDPFASSGYYVEVGRMDPGGVFQSENSYYNVSHLVTESGKFYRLQAFGNGVVGQNAVCYSGVSPVSPLPTIVKMRLKKHKPKVLVAQVDPVFTGTTVTYQWFRQKKNKAPRSINGAVGSTYKPRGKDHGKSLFVQVTYGGGGTTPTVLSSNTKKVR